MRSRFACLIGAAAFALVATSTAVPAPATSSPADPGVLDRAARAVKPGRTHTVTLITGDTVHVTVTPDGGYQTRTDVAPRPDGRPVVITTLTGGGHTYVLPSDAADLVAAGRLDRRLFDIEQLIADGYARRESTRLPVIVQFRGDPALGPQARSRLHARADALPASEPRRTLESINGVALDVSSAGARDFWSSVSETAAPAGRTRLDEGVTRVWLDERVEAALDTSVAQIGAPQAWEAGYDGSGVNVAILDTGIDSAHPDLEGRIVAAKSFVPDDTVDDGNGHGTHVASTVAGSGAASDGTYRGVAPGARLVIGKVLDDSGNGLSSWIIDGMEWAAQTQNAPIVSMSLGSRAASDGTDPMSQAVNELTEQTGALFVVAAGNSGPAARSIGAPGAADAAFTVAAVDDADQLAGFSSRGPRMADYAFKPDIAAPGVDITAARADGTALGPIVDEHYTTISGTSMATPHVAGAAAILLQQHPGWTADQIKAALAGTAYDAGHTAYEQGAGRIDVAAASTATVLPETAKIDVGRLRYPQSGPPVTRTVTYRNDGDQPVTLSLSAELTSESGAAAPAGMITVTPDTIEVPAGGTAQATVGLDPTLGDFGLYSGTVLATADGVSLRTPIAAYKEPEGFDLSVRTILPDDAYQAQASTVVIRRMDTDDGQWTVLPGGGSASVHLEKGVYSIAQFALWADRPANVDNMAYLGAPEVDLNGDTTVTLDVNEAVRLDPRVDRPVEFLGTTMSGWLIPEGSEATYGVVSDQIPYQVASWATPTSQVTTGEFFFEHNHLMGTPLITAEVPRHGRTPALRLHPRYQHYVVNVPKLDGRKTLEVVDVGSGSDAEFARVNVRGKVALIDVGDKGLAPILGLNFAREELENAAEAGAAAVFGYGDEGVPALGTVWMTHGAYPDVPTIALPAEDGEALRDRVARGRTTVRIDSRPTIPDVYALSYLEQGAIPETVPDRVREHELATLDTTIHGDRPVAASQYWSPLRPTIVNPDGLAKSHAGLWLEDIPGPFSRTEHVGPVSAATVWWRAVHSYDLDRMLELDRGHVVEVAMGSMFGVDVFDRPVSRREIWNEAPSVPGMFVAEPSVLGQLPPEEQPVCAACRYAGVFPGGDLLPLLTSTVDASGHHGELTSYSNEPTIPGREGVDEWHLYADGVELPQQSLIGEPGKLPYYILPPEPADYRLTEHFVDQDIKGGYGTRADTTWTFSSRAPAGKEVPAGYDPLGLCADKCAALPLIFLRYDFDLRPDNRLPAPGVHSFVVTAYRQPSSKPMPRLTKFTLQASFDEGKHWKQVPAIPLGDGRYRVVLPHPPLRDPAGSVSLRVEARDAAGNSVKQVLHGAYGLVRRH